MDNAEISNRLKRVLSYLRRGKFKIALPIAEQLYKSTPKSQMAVIVFAWALLENNYPKDAKNLIYQIDEETIISSEALSYLAFLHQRLGNLNDALSLSGKTISFQKNNLGWTYFNQAKIFASLNKFDDARISVNYSLRFDNSNKSKIDKMGEYLFICRELQKGKTKIKPRNVKEYLKVCDEAMQTGENWLPIFVIEKILNDEKLSEFKDTALLIYLNALINQFKYSSAIKYARKNKKLLKSDNEFLELYKKILHLNGIDPKEELGLLTKLAETGLHTTKENLDKTAAEKETKETGKRKDTTSIPKNKRTDFVYFPNDTAEVFLCKLFDADEESITGKRKYYTEIDADATDSIGVEVIFNNPFFRIETNIFEGKAVWYLNDFQKHVNYFELTVRDDWDSVVFTQNYNLKEKQKWDLGQGKVEIYLNDFKIAEKWFWIGNVGIEEIIETPLPKKTKSNAPFENSEIQEPDSQKSLDKLLAELDEFVGLENVKKSVKNFVDYLAFMRERKNRGLKAQEGISINTIFTGNPGTGKTTIARLLGDIFKAMGILEKGHVVEVDRSALVGQYIGETAQKTEKVIESAMQGILFIDEAYTLVKKDGGQDFGQEAIDILLKRMEDKKGQFAVIAAGYPEPMETFLKSNPGLKSRFTQFITFDDYAPAELIEILKLQLQKEEYVLSEDAETILLKHFTKLYRAKDETFGNARLARGISVDLKLSLSKRYLSTPESQRTTESMMTIQKEDVENIFEDVKNNSVNIPIDEDALTDALNELDKLVGLASVKKEIQDLIKLARYFTEQGESVRSKFSSHILFLGSPGTGKTTIARIFSKIYSALGILPKGHLVEVDRQNLVGSHVGETAQKTTSIINKAIGGTLFIDEAYTLIAGASGNDFGKEAIDTLLKRMEDDRGKFITIAAGYTDEMKKFISSNPGIKSRFTKSFFFEDYTPVELLTLTKIYVNNKSASLGPEAQEKLEKHFNEIYRTRDKEFGNARLVRTMVDDAYQQMLLRVSALNKEEQEKAKNIIISEDFNVLSQNTKQKKKYIIKGDPERLKELVGELQNLVGLSEVKKSVQRLISSIKITKLRKERGLRVIEKSMHSVFLGHPGTGKTTVARLLSKIYKELGILEKGHLIEVDRADLISGYQGQTAIKVNKVIQDALGGTLFIDEAYTLTRGKNEFGQEAIDTLLKKMEDYKGQFIVIVAGYTDEMQQFFESNRGLKSRFSNYFEFEDYVPRQLLTIAADFAEKNGYILDEGALQLLLEIFADLYEKRDAHFGNARTARNFLDKAISNQEERISKCDHQSDEELITIIYDDVEPLCPKRH